VALDIPDYFDVVKQPMDLGTIGHKLQTDQYAQVSEFLEDLELVWSNCLLYNPPEDPISAWAKLLREETHRLVRQFGVIEIEGEQEASKKGGDGGDGGDLEGRRQQRRVRTSHDDDDEYQEDPPSRRRSSARLSAKSGRRYYGEDEEEEEESDQDLPDGSERSSRRNAVQPDMEGGSPPESGGPCPPVGPIVEKILADRLRPAKSESHEKLSKQREFGTEADQEAGETEREQNDDESPNGEAERAADTVTEYYVKWKDKSYLHCEWVTADVIESEGTVGRGKINRYLKKKQDMMTSGEMAGPKDADMEEPPFPPSYCEIDRIIGFEEVIEKIPDKPPPSDRQPSLAPIPVQVEDAKPSSSSSPLPSRDQPHAYLPPPQPQALLSEVSPVGPLP